MLALGETMASIYDVKPTFQRLLQPALRALRRLGVTPNGLTLAAVAGSVLVGAWLGAGRGADLSLLVLPAWLLLRMALNALDGMMARQYEMQSPVGAVLNELGDVVSDAVLYLPLALRLDSERAGFVFVLGAVLTELCGILSQALGAGRRYDGPMGKSDRAFVVGLGCIVLVAWPEGQSFAALVFYVLAGLTVLTCIQRLRPATRGGEA